MVHALIRLALIFMAMPAFAAQDYHGAWFTIAYPDGFTAIEGIPSTTADGHDSARFRDPSGRVEFYVYSPQAGGIATDIVPDPSVETQVAVADQKGATGTVRWTTYAAKDGSYQRSVEETRSADGTQNRVFGIKYRTSADLADFRDAYRAFKESLKQYQD
ncbi:hypothetical protein [Phyllobacterium lublinensis]|uniref:hypothetical protein n=1 Tax=Phyllobacterium lublinensis TaxID=2875708 RepID=UPI001CCCB5C9|nr:hypothetical protein [Phyllobacterium sp. 2063]MBZ9655182.1 hypothetical protein [Phyllobacterium sp. 2063]